MSRKIFLALIVILTVVNVTAAVTIAYERWIRKTPSEESFRTRVPMEELGRRLDLTPDQIERMRRSRRDFMGQADEHRQELIGLHDRLFSEVAKDQPDSLIIDSVIDRIGSLQAQMQKTAVDHLLHERQYLSPDQRRRLLDLFKDHMRMDGRLWLDRGHPGRMRGMGRRLDRSPAMDTDEFDATISPKSTDGGRP